jgi:hypothetical protein
MSDDAIYTYSVQAQSSDGETVAVEEWLVGVVDAMEYKSGTPLPSINGATFTLSDILKLTNVDDLAASTDESEDATEESESTDESEAS